MEDFSWQSLLFTIFSVAAMPWLAAFLRAKRIRFLKIFSFCSLSFAVLAYISLIAPKVTLSDGICWIPIADYCLPSPLVFVVGFLLGGGIALLLWVLIKSQES